MINTLLSHGDLRSKNNISYTLLIYNQNLNIKNENFMAFEGLGEMVVGYFTDTCDEKISLGLMGYL